MDHLIVKLDEIEATFKEIDSQLADPNIVSDQNKLKVLARTRRQLEPTIKAYDDYRQLLKDLDEWQAMLRETQDKDERLEIEHQIEELRKKDLELVELLKLLLLPVDPNDDKSIMVEIRAGAGGDEASIFAGDLLRMYSRYADKLGWKYEVESFHEAELGGYKEVIFSVKADGAYRQFKFESGVHRVQRVPQTEAQGRVHTSTATVAVMPEAEEVEVELLDVDLEISTMRSGGAGGQNVNKVETAVRIVHKHLAFKLLAQKSAVSFRTKSAPNRFCATSFIKFSWKNNKKQFTTSANRRWEQAIAQKKFAPITTKIIASQIIA